MLQRGCLLSAALVSRSIPQLSSSTAVLNAACSTPQTWSTSSHSFTAAASYNNTPSSLPSGNRSCTASSTSSSTTTTTTPGSSNQSSFPSCPTAQTTSSSTQTAMQRSPRCIPLLPKHLHLSTWHQLQQHAGYRPPVKAKQGGKKGAAAAKDAGGAGEGGTGAYEDDTPPASDAVRVVLQAVDNVTPHLDVRTIRSATKTTYVPGVMPAEKGRSLALHWLVAAAEARKKSSKGSFAECLALELLLAYQKRGSARQKRDDLHKLALQNRANLHLRWW